MRPLFKGRAVFGMRSGKKLVMPCDDIEVKTVGGELTGFHAIGTDVDEDRVMHINIAEIVYITWTAPLFPATLFRAPR